MAYEKVAISGKICSGKTTVANHLIDMLGFGKISSADTLKEICKQMAYISRLFDENAEEEIIRASIMVLVQMVRDITHDQTEFEMMIGRLFMLRKQFSHVKDFSNKTDDVRLMLQVVANTILNEVRQTIWIDSAIATMKERTLVDGITRFAHDDMRYPFEYDALKKSGFLLIRLEVSPEVQEARVKQLYGEVNPERLMHISETALDKHTFDHVVNADQPLDAMLEEIMKIVKG